MIPGALTSLLAFPPSFVTSAVQTLIARLRANYEINTALLMPLADASDTMGNSVTNVGVTFGAPALGKFGLECAVFDGSSSLTIAPGPGPAPRWAFGASDFTVEAWVRPTSGMQTFTVLSSNYRSSDPTAGNWAMFFQPGASAPLSFLASTPEAQARTSTSAPVVALNTWTHLAYSRQGTTGRFFVNGVKEGLDVSDATVYGGASGSLFIGQQSEGEAGAIGQMSQLRVTTGLARYVQDFSLPAAPWPVPLNVDPFFDNNVVLMPLDSDIADVLGSYVGASPGPGVAFSSSVRKFPGTQSCAFNSAAGTYLELRASTKYAVARANFTAEAWVYPTSLPNALNVIMGTADWSLRVGPTGALSYNASGAPSPLTSAVGSVALNTWTHVAVTRSGAGSAANNMCSLWINGALVASANVVGGSASDNAFYVGSDSPVAGRGFTGNLSNLRVTAGARYAQPFVVPWAAWPQQGITASDYDPFGPQVVMLALLDGSAQDAARGAAPFVFNNGVSFSTSTKKFGAPAAYFDGSAQMYAHAAHAGNLSLALGLQDFTIETWAYFNTASGNQFIFDWRPQGTNGAYPCLFLTPTRALVYFVDNSFRITSAQAAVGLTTWNHIAVSRSAGVTRVFVNGAQVGSTYSDPWAYLTPPGRPFLGRSGFAGTGGALMGISDGYLSNFRVTKGVGRYSGLQDFAPVQKAFSTVLAPGESAALLPLDVFSAQTVLFLNGENAAPTSLSGGNTEFLDSSGRNVTVTPSGVLGQGAFTPWDFGREYAPAVDGASVYFSGSPDKLTLGTNLLDALALQSFTFETWVWADSAAAGGPRQLVYLGGASNGYLSLGIQLTGSNTITFTLAGNLLVAITAPWVGKNDAWQHVAVTRAGSTWTAYVNGASVGTYVSPWSVSPTNTIHNIGAYNNSYYFFKGYMAGMRLVAGGNEALVYGPAAFVPPAAPPQVAQGPGVSTLLLLKFANAGVVDATGRNIVQTLGTPGAARSSPLAPLFGSASLRFDGSNGAVSVPHSSALELGSSDFTVEFWMNPLSTGGAHRTLFSKRANNSSNCGIALLQLGPALVLLATTSSGGWNVANNLSTGPVLTSGTWTHVAVTRAQGFISLRVNGVLKLITARFTGTLLATTAALRVGGESNGFYFHGYLDDFSITNGISRYNADFAGPAQRPFCYSTRAESEYEARRGDDAHGSNVVLHLGFDSSGVHDTTGQTYVANYGVVSGVSQQFVENGAGLFSSAFLRLPAGRAWDFGTQDFTVDLWYNTPPVGGSGANARLFQTDDGDVFAGLSICDNQGAIDVRFAGPTGTSWDVVLAQTPIPTGVWNHLAVTRRATIIELYLNGIRRATAPVTAAFAVRWTQTATPVVGGQTGLTRCVKGLIDNLRVTKGVSRYLANFTPKAKS